MNELETVSVLFTDAVASTALEERVGPDRANTALFEHFGTAPDATYSYTSTTGVKTVNQTTAGTWLLSATNSSGDFNCMHMTVDLTNDSDRAHYIRGRLEHGKFTPVGRQESHALFGLSQSNALLRLDLGHSLKADEIVDVQIWDW